MSGSCCCHFSHYWTASTRQKTWYFFCDRVSSSLVTSNWIRKFATSLIMHIIAITYLLRLRNSHQSPVSSSSFIRRSFEMTVKKAHMPCLFVCVCVYREWNMGTWMCLVCTTGDRFREAREQPLAQFEHNLWMHIMEHCVNTRKMDYHLCSASRAPAPPFTVRVPLSHASHCSSV